MRKILMSILVIALLALFGGIVYNGITIGETHIGYSIPAIIKANDHLDTQIAALGTEIDSNYQYAKSDLDASFKKLQQEKQSYQSTIAYTTEEELKNANKTEQYKLDYLWTNIGVYATNNNVILKADLSHGTSGVKNQYNITFTAIGEYLSISEFVYAIEKDANLGFRIEEFSLVPYSEDSLQATFIIKNINVDPNSLSQSAKVTNGTVTNKTNEDNKDKNDENKDSSNDKEKTENNNNTSKQNTNNTNKENTVNGDKKNTNTEDK